MKISPDNSVLPLVKEVQEVGTEEATALLETGNWVLIQSFVSEGVLVWIAGRV